MIPNTMISLGILGYMALAFGFGIWMRKGKWPNESGLEATHPSKGENVVYFGAERRNLDRENSDQRKAA